MTNVFAFPTTREPYTPPPCDVEIGPPQDIQSNRVLISYAVATSWLVVIGAVAVIRAIVLALI